MLVLEPSYGPKGAVKTARKGVGEYSLKVTGVAAHSGLDFEKGQSAILELARQIQAISKMVDLKRGLTLNVGLVGGGTRINVVAAEATASLDVRVARMKDAAGIDKQLRSLKPFNRKCKLEITGGGRIVPPWSERRGSPPLYQKAVSNRPRSGLEAERGCRRRRIGRQLHRRPRHSQPSTAWEGWEMVLTPFMSSSPLRNCPVGQRCWRD